MNKILWHSNAPWAPSGYGVQTAQVAPRLRDQGVDVALSAFYGLHGGSLVWNGMKVFPGGYSSWGMDIIRGHALQHFGENLDDGLVVSLMDAWVIDPEVSRGLNWANWTPVDHDEVPPAVRGVLQEGEIIPISMSNHGHMALIAAGLDPVYVPHCVDTEFYYPWPEETRLTDLRRRLNWPEEHFVVGVVAANRGRPSRKSIPEIIEAFAHFAAGKNDVCLYLHTEMNGVHEGFNIPAQMQHLGIPPEKVRIFDPYHLAIGGNPDLMRDAYASMDVLLSPSMGEGFGVPIIEAQACGTPVIVGDWTSMPELCGAGWQVSGIQTWTNQRGYMHTPSVPMIVQALDGAYQMARRQRERAREFALLYDTKLVVKNFWIPALAEIEERLEVEVVS